MVLELHRRQLAEHGGAPGLRAAGLLDSALSRAPHRFTYEPETDLAGLAAAYSFGLAKNHPFVDGNKRLAFLAMYVFLGLNGQELEAPEPEVVRMMERLAAGRLSERALAAWLRTHLRPLPRDPR